MSAKPNQYPIPTKLKLHAAWREMWPSLFLLGPVPFLVPYAAGFRGWDHSGVWALIAWGVFSLLLTAYGVWWSSRNRSVRYEVDGITVIWADRRYYVPPEKYRSFVQKNVWEPFVRQADNPSELTRGVVMVYEGTRPYVAVREKDGKIGYKHVWGATWPWKALSRVDASSRLSDGVDGHELRLHCCHALYPGRSEREDIEWMQDEGIIA